MHVPKSTLFAAFALVLLAVGLRPAAADSPTGRECAAFIVPPQVYKERKGWEARRPGNQPATLVLPEGFTPVGGAGVGQGGYVSGAFVVACR